ncbi:hypothetical protein ACQKFS_01115 [Pseudomonas guineae]|uniref:hypothetical protein n=1 Tax=Pseudomonas guineae TaxID=425504 RepID=UPI003D0634A1
MKALLKKEFAKGFSLEEENIIKLADICKKRLSEAEITDSLKYKIYRKDSMVYESSEYAQLLQEENSTRNQITRIDISCNADDFSMRLTFDKEDKVTLQIEAEDKDQAYLIFSDIKEYLFTEVLKFRSFKFSSALSANVMFPVFMMAMFVIMFSLIGRGAMSSDQFQTLISSGSIDAKLNYLLTQSRKNADTTNIWPLLGGLGAFMFFVFAVGPILDKYFPVNIFIWGKEKAKYEKLCALRAKIIWGICIAFIIGVASSLFVMYLAPRV